MTEINIIYFRDIKKLKISVKLIKRNNDIQDALIASKKWGFMNELYSNITAILPAYNEEIAIGSMVSCIQNMIQREVFT